MAAALSSATAAALRAATRTADEPELVELTRMPGSGRYDLCLPVSNHTQTASLVMDVKTWEETRQSGSPSNVLAPLSQATTAGELYKAQVEAAVTRYSKKLQVIADSYAKAGKYTKEHAEQMVAARGALYKELADVFPPANFFRVASSDASLQSVEAASREAADLAALPSLSGKSLDNLSRNMVKRGKSAVTAAQDVPVIVDKRIATKLKFLDHLLIFVTLAPIAVAGLTAESDEERERALKEFLIATSKVAVDKAVTASVMTFCAAFTVTSLGWGLVACGLGAAAAGIYVSGEAEGLLKKVLPAPVPP